jgi:virginiamycin B lyase
MRSKLLIAVLLCASLPANAQQKPPNLPDGPGKEQVAALCSGCHGLGRVMSSGYAQAYWHTAVRMMINFGVAIPPEQVQVISDYLAANFPEKPKPDANIVPGPAKVTIREWQVPIPGSRPHDPLATRDGAIWYTGQMTNRLGRVDPRTGQAREYPLKSPATGPHGLVEDRDGNIFFTIVRFDPKTEKFQTWAIPSGGYIVRKMDVTPDGNPVIATSTVNGVGMVEVK